LIRFEALADLKEKEIEKHCGKDMDIINGDEIDD
jgi:hypothetical protein